MNQSPWPVATLTLCAMILALPALAQQPGVPDPDPAEDEAAVLAVVDKPDSAAALRAEARRRLAAGADAG